MATTPANRTTSQSVLMRRYGGSSRHVLARGHTQAAATEMHPNHTHLLRELGQHEVTKRVVRAEGCRLAVGRNV